MIGAALISRLAPYLIAAALAGGGVWWVMGLREENAALRSDVDRLTRVLAGCTARASNLIEDNESDAKVDNMPDLRAVPDEWLFVVPDTPGPSSVY